MVFAHFFSVVQLSLLPGERVEAADEDGGFSFQEGEKEGEQQTDQAGYGAGESHAHLCSSVGFWCFGVSEI